MWGGKIFISGIIFLIIDLLHCNSNFCFAQGKNYNWLLGYNIALDSFTTSTKARLLFDLSTDTLIPEIRKLPFNSTQANISDENGNLLISTNGCWIANANCDTMLNGAGLNPAPFTTSYCSFIGIPYAHADILLPWPGDTTKYILFHQTSDDPSHYRALNLFYSIIDMTLDGGLGGVDTAQKNISIIQDKLSIGISACKHSNGRDWWIISQRDSSDTIYKILLTPNGIANISNQSMGMPIALTQSGQPTFSPDGNKFVYSTLSGTVNNAYRDIRLFDFDRCTGIFTNPHLINITDSLPGFGISFSSNSKFLYGCSYFHIFQINMDSLIVDTIATWDGYASPNPPFYTLFWLMYRAPNGKIYISTANSTLDLHYINFPDSNGISCDVQQHALHLPCYAVRANVNHPNYYLGPVVGSVCDSLTGMNEHLNEIINFKIKPNPNNGSFAINYLLPQTNNRGQPGVFEIFDIMGQKVYRLALPPWSTLQEIQLPDISDGVYSAVITSNRVRVSRKLIVLNH